MTSIVDTPVAVLVILVGAIVALTIPVNGRLKTNVDPVVEGQVA
jgi:hypothetical protein